jgi:hypothetical protein
MIDYSFKHISAKIPFMPSRLETFIDSKRSAVLEVQDEYTDYRRIVAAGYSLIKDVLSGNSVHPELEVVKNSSGETVAIIQQAFSTQNAGFLQQCPTETIAAASLCSYNALIDSFVQQGLGKFDFLSKFRGITIPRIYLQIDDINSAASILHVDRDMFERALVKIGFWKASEHFLFGSTTNSDHDFPSYVEKTAEETGITRYQRVLQHFKHERNHLIVDSILVPRFGGFINFQEGLCEYFAGRLEDSGKRFRNHDLNPDDISFALIESSDDEIIQYAGGCILAHRIGMKFNPANPQLGLVNFLSELYDDGSRSDVGFEVAAQRILSGR